MELLFHHGIIGYLDGFEGHADSSKMREKKKRRQKGNRASR